MKINVSFAVKNSLLTVTEPPLNGSERIITIRFSPKTGRANIMSVYAPTLCFTAESKDQFYEELDVAISNIPKTEQLYILGDFNNNKIFIIAHHDIQWHMVKIKIK